MEDEKSLKDLEEAINSVGKPDSDEFPKESNQTELSPSEEIAFHKGAISTLVNERNELIKMAGTVEKIMKMHIDRLKELGVKLE